MLIKDAITEFLDYLAVELNRSPHTCSGYGKDLNVFLKYLEETDELLLAVQELTPETFSGYLRHLARDRQSKPNTLRRHVTTVKSFCNFLVNSEYLEQNPAAALPRPRMPQKQPRHLQQTEVEQLFAAVSETDSAAKLRDKTALMFMYYTGVRVAELVSVRKADLDLDSGFIKIVKGKGSRFRKVPLHNRLGEQLGKYLAGAPQLVNEFLFSNREGTKLSTDYIHHIIGIYARAAGLTKKVTPHMLRHSFATHLYTDEVDLNTLSKLLGHESIRTTSVYTHADLKQLRAAVNKLPASDKLAALLFDKGAEKSAAGTPDQRLP